MTETPAPDAAALIVVDVLGFHALTDDQMADDVVAALARADRLCEPGTKARLATLEAVVDELFWAVKSNDEPSSPRLVVAMRETQKMLDALDAAPAGSVDR